AIPLLRINLNHSHEDVQSEVIEALALIAPEPGNTFLDSLKSENVQERKNALRVLSKMGAKANEVSIPLIEYAAKEQEPVVRVVLLGALIQVRADKTRMLPLLLEDIQSDQPIIRNAAINALLAMEPSGKKVIPELRKLLNHQ